MSLSLKHFYRNSLIGSGLFLAAQALALQINQPVLISRIGEPLQLEFLVTDVSEAEEKSLKINLADILVYQSTQIKRVAGLDDIKFEFTKQSDGKYKVNVTGTQPISEERADLIVDFDWASGRRFINIGLNLQTPPVSTTAAPIATTSAAPASDTQTEQPLTNPAPPASQPEQAGIAPPAPSSEQTAVPSPKQTTTPVAASTATDSAVNQSTASQVQIQQGDTAGELLQSLATREISLDQLLLAMLHNNPDAFVASNVNRLKAGALVTMPTSDEAATFDRKQARESIQLQASDFNAYRTSLGYSAPVSNQTLGSKRESSGKLKGEVTKKEKPPADELTLSKPGDSEAEKLSKKLQEEESAKQAKEVSDNLSQLGRLSRSASQFTQGFAANFSGLGAYYDQGLELAKHYMFELIAAIALLAAFAVSFSLMRDKRRLSENEESADFSFQDDAPTQGLNLPPDLNLDLETPETAQHSQQKVPSPAHTVDMPAFPSESKSSVIDPGEDPFIMRLELADELWKLGQKQTALALAQEVADQTLGETRELAQRWLNEHT
jgi:FimV-like protein